MKGKLLIVVLGLTALFVSGLLISINKSYACPPPPPPPPIAILEADPERVLVGTDEVTLDGSGSYYNIVEYKWDFDGDGDYDYTESPGDGIATHTYNTIGTYTPKLRVKRSGSGTTTATDTCTVYVVEVKNLNTEVRYRSIVAAIAADQTADNDIIEVSVGTYEENLEFTSEKITLTSTDPDDPEVVAATIIDGGGDDRVVTFDSGDADSTITGFTITNGGYVTNGGGIYCNGVSATITNCVITGNGAGNGGGMYIDNCAPSISNCTFSENNSGICGGGLYAKDSDYTISNCTFHSNISNQSAGGIHNLNSDAEITDCDFIENNGDDGGGMCDFNSSPTVTDCNFIGNETSGNGGGMVNIGTGNVGRIPIVTNCIFEDNIAYNDGGGMGNYFLSHPNVTNCLFIGNTSGCEGGGIFNDNKDYDHLVGVYGTLEITNCTFIENIAGGDGASGAICDFYASNYIEAIVTNCIFWDNSDETEDQVFYEYRNCDIYCDATPIQLNYCCIQGGWSGAGGDGIIISNPAFVNINDPNGADNKWRTADDGLALDSGSPCIDAADSNDTPTTDMLGNSRYDDPNTTNTGVGDPNYYDMGAYEYQG